MKKLRLQKSRLVTLLLFASAGIIQAHAGGILTNTNQNVAFDRNFAREATMEIDGALTNPAGMAWIGEGWHLSINWQSSFQNRNIDATFAPFMQNATSPADAEGNKRFKGETVQPFIPSLQAAWQKGNWTFSAVAAYIGGGGKCVFNDGLPSFESQVAMLPAALTAAGINSSKYDVDCYMYGRQYVYSLQAGATWRVFGEPAQDGSVSQGLALYAGMRVNYLSNKYRARLCRISADINGSMTELSPYFQENATALQNAADGARQSGNEPVAAAYEQQAAVMAAYAQKTMDKKLDCGQSGWGVTPIIGADFRIGKLNLGARCEFNTHISMKNDTRINTSGLAAYDDGVRSHADIPSLLTFGAQYDILPSWRVMAGWHHFFDKEACMTGHKECQLRHDSNEFTMGTEVKVSDRVTLSCGGQITRYGLDDGFQSDMSFTLNSYSAGFGAKVKLSDRLDLNVAYFWTGYSDYDKSFTNYNGCGLAAKEVYGRTNKVFGAGINIRL